MNILKVMFFHIGVCLACYITAKELMVLTSSVAFMLGMNRANSVMTSVMLGFLYLWILLLWQLPFRHSWHVFRTLGILWLFVKCLSSISLWIILKEPLLVN